MSVTITARVLADDRDVACQGLAASVQWGRQDAYGQPESQTCTVTLDDPDGSAAAQLDVGQTLTLVAVGPGWESVRFTGWVADVTISHAEGVTTVAGQGLLARLARTWVGDTPWPVELDGDRVLRIMQLAGLNVAADVTWEQAQGTWASPDIPGHPTNVNWAPWSDPSWDGQVWQLTPGTWRELSGLTWRDLQGPDVDVGAVQMNPMDVDRRNVAELLREVATSAAGVIFERANGQLAYHDADRRTWELDADLSACLWLSAGATFTKTQASVVNELEVSWGQGATPDDAQPRFYVEDLPSKAAYDSRAEQWVTQLAELGDAYQLATRRLRWLAWPRWQVEALNVDSQTADDSAQLAQLMGLQLGDTVKIAGVAAPTPAPDLLLCVEGASEQLEAGSWRATYYLTDARQTVAGHSWNDHGLADPARRWVDVPRDVAWYEADDLLTGR